MAAELDFRHVSAEGVDGAALLAAMTDEMRELYWDVGDGLDINSPDMPAAGPADLSPPGGTFLVGYRDGEPVCGGGIKQLGHGACEIKRMYVVPAARRQGIARELLHALEAAAHQLGYDVVRLDTGPRQPHARGMYLAEGYREIPNFNGNPVATFFGEKRLSED
ncbi:GNAT family N-acetyltransferase [Mycobacterium sp. 2YAF39]|uniref:GNAT family N-acetyltransferase n=1 Tax=Mycobacterium sp. 2YAF39 TaxID=3233033 RepID=UPI003F9A7EA1